MKSQAFLRRGSLAFFVSPPLEILKFANRMQYFMKLCVYIMKH